MNPLHVDIEERSETAFSLLEKLKSGSVQSEADVPEWASSFVEAVLVGVPVRGFAAVLRPSGREPVTEIVDGRRRLATLAAFERGEFALTGMAFMPGIEGRRFAELQPFVQRSLLETRIPITVVRDVWKDPEATAFAVRTLTGRQFQ